MTMKGCHGANDGTSASEQDFTVDLGAHRTASRRKLLPRLDLNLLLVFEAVMLERSVTRAAQRLNVSQSTISHALNRFRLAVKDELFIRSTGEMRPTPRAIALADA